MVCRLRHATAHSGRFKPVLKQISCTPKQRTSPFRTESAFSEPTCGKMFRISSVQMQYCNERFSTIIAETIQKGQDMGRPLPTFHGFVGQNHIVDSLRNHCSGAIKQGFVLNSVGLFGMSGMGKSELARSLSVELGTSFLDYYCSSQTNRRSLVEHLRKARKGDLVFLDEAQLIPPNCQMVLYRALERWEVPALDENGRCIENTFVPVEPFCLVIATDRPSALNRALIRRIALQYVLTDYTTEEMKTIVMNHASRLGLLLSGQAARRIGEASQNPRTARFIVESLNTCIGGSETAVTKRQAERHLMNQGIDKDNLNRLQRSYLSALARQGSYLSLSNLSVSVGLDAQSLVKEVEPALLKAGWLMIDARGRYLSDKGKSFVEERSL